MNANALTNMTNTLLWPLPPPPTLGIVGSARRLPVRRVFCVGRNYQNHALEMGAPVDKASMAPFYFLKDAGSLLSVAAGRCARLPYPPATADFHHEAELVVVIGAPGFRVRAAAATALIYGYAAGLDMTRRDLQQRAKDGRQPWDLAKNFEQGAVCGDVLPAAKVLDAGEISLRVNGELRQHGALEHMIWSISELLADLSRYYHLQPGDLLYTGTPAGVGPVRTGDRLEVAIEGVGGLCVEIG